MMGKVREKPQSKLKNKRAICGTCKKTFSKISNLNQHTKNVHLGRAFACTLCNEKQSTKHAHLRHIERFHKDENIQNVEENEIYVKEKSEKLSEKAKDAMIIRLKKENEAIRNELAEYKAKDTIISKLREENEAIRREFTEYKNKSKTELSGDAMVVPLLPNGYSTGAKNAVATCAFDTLLSFYAVLFADSPSFRTKINEMSQIGPFFRLVKASFSNETEEILKNRNTLLKSYYNRKKRLPIDCTTTFKDIFDKICSSDEYLHSYTIEYSCKKCNNAIQKKNSFVRIHAKRFNVTKIQTSIDQKCSSEKCGKCGVSMKGQGAANDVIVIDADSPDLSKVNEMITMNGNKWYPALPNAAIKEISDTVHF